MPANLESPRLQALRDQIAAGAGNEAIWQEIQRSGTPLIQSRSTRTTTW